MKLLRLKITDPKGFRSFAPGFEYYFRLNEGSQDDVTPLDFQPFVCAGRNGSGKSNLLEMLASIFFQLEVQRIRRNFLPAALEDGGAESGPRGFELEYLMPLDASMQTGAGKPCAHVRIIKQVGFSPEVAWVDPPGGIERSVSEQERDFLLPAYIVGYSSGENEILSLPFFKMRFVQFDEYWNSLKEQLPYPGRPDGRMAYLDREFSQAILLCNLLFQTPETLMAYAGDIGLTGVKRFRIMLRERTGIDMGQVLEFGSATPNWKEPCEILDFHPHLVREFDRSGFEGRSVKMLGLLAPIIDGLKRCATCWSVDAATDTLILDFWVNNATREVFRANYGSALELFQALQVLLTLNLYSVSDELKADLYQSSSHYVNETIPVLASDERIMRFKEVYVTKEGVAQPLLLKELSDGEHQLLHTLGLCLLFRNTNSLFLLDEPETHLNPDWRAEFITRMRQCLLQPGSSEDNVPPGPEVLITTHTPFLISDSKPDKVLVFKKDEVGKVTIEQPDYNTLGASINKITMKTFEKTETVGGVASLLIQAFRARIENGEVPEILIDEIDQTLGDSVEKIMLLNSILGIKEPQS